MRSKREGTEIGTSRQIEIYISRFNNYMIGSERFAIYDDVYSQYIKVDHYGPEFQAIQVRFL